MKPLKLSYLLILIVLALFLSGASESAELDPNPQLENVWPNDHDLSTEYAETSADNDPDEPTLFQAQLLEILRSIADTQNARYKQEQTQQESWDSPSVLINAVLVVVAIIYTVFAGFQWRAIRRQANIAAETLNAINLQARTAADGVIEARRAADAATTGLHLLQRAYLEIDLTEKSILKTDELLTIQLRLKNYGPSRARAVKTWLGISQDIERPQPRQPDTNAEKATSMIIPGMGHRIYFVGFQEESDKLTDERISLIKEGKITLVVFGHFIYSDIFGNEHFTRFFRIYDPRTQHWVFPENDNPEYNDAD